MNKRRLEKLARNFPDSGIQLLFEDPLNVRDALNIAAPDFVDRIDFSQLERIRATFVLKNFRKRESDLVFTAPFDARRGRRKNAITIYILIEHQSDPDPLMGFRMLFYMMLIWDKQREQWMKDHKSYRGFRFQPILPLVFYTGTKEWKSLDGLVERMAFAETFEEFIPDPKLLFLNLRDTPPDTIIEQGGWFGWLMRVVQARQSSLAEFRAVVREATEQLETMPEKQKNRWLNLVSFMEALIYHYRDADEVPVIQQEIEDVVESQEYLKEIEAMKNSYAQTLKRAGKREGKREGKLDGQQKILIRQLSQKFGGISVEVTRIIESTQDEEQLELWLDKVLFTESIDDFDFSAN